MKYWLIEILHKKERNKNGCLCAGGIIHWRKIRVANVVELNSHEGKFIDNEDGTVTRTEIQCEFITENKVYGMPDQKKELNKQLNLF